MAAIRPWWREAIFTRFRTASLCGALASRGVGGGPSPGCFAASVRCGGCGRVLSTHTVQHGSIIYCYYRCRSTAGGRDPCKGALVSAGEIDHAVLEAAGIKDKWLTSKEQEAAVRGVIRQIVYKAAKQRVEIEFRPGTAIGERLADGVLSKV